MMNSTIWPNITVLSKLRHKGDKPGTCGSPGRERLKSSLSEMFNNRLNGLNFVPGGTLGVCFSACLNGVPRFFKTHALPSGFVTLQREAAFLWVTATDITDAHLLQSTDSKNERVWLHTKFLKHCAPLRPPEVLALIDGYDERLKRHPELANLVPTSHSIGHLLSEADSALDFMIENNVLSPLVIEKTSSVIEQLKSVCACLPLQLCHGDLGPANIMINDSSFVALDWEDVFWGVAGYDYLYWLTFFSNRKWLSRDVLGHTALDRQTEIGLMLIIILLKSWMSVLNGSCTQNAISIDDRLSQVIKLD